MVTLSAESCEMSGVLCDSLISLEAALAGNLEDRTCCWFDAVVVE